MSRFAFVCAREDDDLDHDGPHQTATAMVRCRRCEKYAVGGYMCETCGHSDVDPHDQLAGHGEGHCEPTPVAERTAGGLS